MAMDIKLQSAAPKGLNSQAKPFSPSSTVKPNYLLHTLYSPPPPPHCMELFMLPPPPPPPPRGFCCYGTVHHTYHHLYNRKVDQFQPPPLIYNPRFVHFSTYLPLKPRDSVVSDCGFNGNKIDGCCDGWLVKRKAKKMGFVKKSVHGGNMAERKVNKNEFARIPKKTGRRVYARVFRKKSFVTVNKPQDMFTGVTTVMMRNIPNKLRRDDLLGILDEHCKKENEMSINSSNRVQSAYDFVYLPIDFKLLGNKGYAFVNFTTSEGATRLREAMKNRGWDDYIESKKQCDFSVARIQGRDALVQHFQESKFPTSTEAFLPVVLLPARDGCSPGAAPKHVGKCIP